MYPVYPCARCGEGFLAAASERAPISIKRNLTLPSKRPTLSPEREGRLQSAERAVPTFTKILEGTNLLSA